MASGFDAARVSRFRRGSEACILHAVLSPGAIFAGRYRVERSVAKGGMGMVYEVVHLETERTRALKVLHGAALDNPDLRERFRREARMTSRVDSEFIVEVFDAGVDEATGVPFLVMEFLRGEELGRLLRRVGRFSPEDVVVYLNQVGMALDKTHAASIVHRDLKPANLFLTLRDDGSPRVKILDFGIAKLVADGDSNGTQSIGTPLYMAPEQLVSGRRISAAVDVHALGLIAYTLLVGTPYWESERKAADNAVAFALKTLQGPTEAPVARAAREGVSLPPAFDAWFSRATALEPEQRWSSAGQATSALADVFASSIGVGRVSFLPSSVPSVPRATPSAPSLATPSSLRHGTDEPWGVSSQDVARVAPNPDSTSPSVQVFQETMTTPGSEPSRSVPRGFPPVLDETATDVALTQLRDTVRPRGPHGVWLAAGGLVLLGLIALGWGFRRTTSETSSAAASSAATTGPVPAEPGSSAAPAPSSSATALRDPGPPGVVGAPAPGPSRREVPRTTSGASSAAAPSPRPAAARSTTVAPHPAANPIYSQD